MKQPAQRTCRVPILGDRQNLMGHSPEKPALDDPT